MIAPGQGDPADSLMQAACPHAAGLRTSCIITIRREVYLRGNPSIQSVRGLNLIGALKGASLNRRRRQPPEPPHGRSTALLLFDLNVPGIGVVNELHAVGRVRDFG